MCGIVGFVGFGGRSAEFAEKLVASMAATIRRRGPDGSGTWIDENHEVAFAHRRLSILDLSEAGRQPMRSASGRYHITFNGEIYNHLDLRRELTGHRWSGSSDTETLLACFDRYGIFSTLRKLCGMFAMAIWDSERCELSLVRDRMGEKPLYYGFLRNRQLVFASELSALVTHPDWVGAIDEGAVGSLLQYASVAGERSIFRGISKLSPGCRLVVDLKRNSHVEKYWCLIEAAARGIDKRSSGNLIEAQVVSEFRELLSGVVKQQLNSDVPIGCLLSGGVDSSLIAALMTSVSDIRPKTFSIGFSERQYDEAPFAAAVAGHLDTDHTDLLVTEKDALGVVELLPDIYSEPFADASQIPTYLVSKLARADVSVVLTGDGGDELFAGYNRYIVAHRIWRFLRLFPRYVRKRVAMALLLVPRQFWISLFSMSEALVVGSAKPTGGYDRFYKFLSKVVVASSPYEMYEALLKHWDDLEEILPGASYHRDAAVHLMGSLPRSASYIDCMCLTDQLNYLLDDILVKVDRAAMAVSLESRVPLLDHRIVEYSWALPLHFKMRGGETKWLLRTVLYGEIPRRLVDRPKMGFSVPIDHWLRSSLREWAEELLSEQKLHSDGIFNASHVRSLWRDHLERNVNHGHKLWNILMYQAWSVRWRPNRESS